ncbi:unnamed protein product [Hymenolepis diminuta]|uniref:Integrase catalytic domain-containing protein n=1 Tax=Hymenolepis diminuta TaxID=6216 RepID=A0A0R3SZM4_HYMDI|nr:unnamed protein product [Hymenolepis diminuta]
MDTRKDSVRVVNADRIRTAGEVDFRIKILNRMVDTGSDIPIVSREAWKSLGRPKLDKVPFKVSSASGDAMQLSGVMKCMSTFKGKAVATVCYVADRDTNLVGLDWIDMFDVLKPKVRSITGSHAQIKEMFRRTENLDEADCLSPLIENQSAENEETVVASVSFERDVQHILAESIRNTPVSVEDIRKEAEIDVVPQQASKKPIRQDPVLCPQTETPWTRLHVDFAGPVSGITYLVVVDSYSKWPEVVPLTVATSGTTIGALDRIFSTHGLPKTLVSDNGTQFTSVDFKEFCQQRSIEHIRIPPYYSQSNGQAETFVDTLKRGLQKAKGEGTMDEVLQNFLLGCRSTPHPAIGEKSPAEVLMDRKLRTVHEVMLPKKTQPHEKRGKKRMNLL